MENSFDFSPYAPKPGHVLVLKSLNSKLIASHNEFQWPESGVCEAPDWLPTQECGKGLHGWLWGAGDADLRCSDSDAKWLVLHVEETTIVNLDGKVKFPKCEVLFVGERDVAVSIIQNFAPPEFAIIFSTLTGGNRSTLTGGYASTLTGGYASTLTGGDASTLTGGNRSTLTGGNRSTLTGGYASTLTGGYASTLTGGDASTLTGGNRSTLTGGYASTLTGGYASTLTGGNRSTLTGGLWGVLVFRFVNDSTNEYEQRCALIDGVNFIPGMKYKLNEKTMVIEQVNDTEA